VRRSLSLPSIALASLAALLLPACDTTRFAAGNAAGIFERAAPAFQEAWDWETARQAMPAGIMRLEGVLRIVPEDERIMLQLIRAYSALGFGFIEDMREDAELAGDYERADHLRARAVRAYERGLYLSKQFMRSRDEGFDDAMHAGPAAFREWVWETFDDEEDANPLVWIGYDWGLYMASNTDDPSVLVDLPFIRALLERSIELDEDYFHCLGLTILGIIDSSVPVDLGGDPESGRVKFERALELTERRALSVQVSYARTYAVNTGNRELFESLMREAVEAGDVLPIARLANKIAKRRAVRWLAQIDTLF
jgi:hypothetical protein